VGLKRGVWVNHEMGGKRIAELYNQSQKVGNAGKKRGGGVRKKRKETDDRRRGRGTI